MKAEHPTWLNISPLFGMDVFTCNEATVVYGRYIEFDTWSLITTKLHRESIHHVHSVVEVESHRLLWKWKHVITSFLTQRKAFIRKCACGYKAIHNGSIYLHFTLYSAMPVSPPQCWLNREIVRVSNTVHYNIGPLIKYANPNPKWTLVLFSKWLQPLF